jgi:hypothetical protein
LGLNFEVFLVGYDVYVTGLFYQIPVIQLNNENMCEDQLKRNMTKYKLTLI